MEGKFPRGTTVTSSEHEKATGVKRSLNQEFLFGQNKRLKSVVSNPTVKKPRSVLTDSVKDQVICPEYGTGKIKAKDLISNVITLGVVLQVNEKSAKISLPGGSIGLVGINEIADFEFDNWTLKNCLREFQTVVCCIMDNVITSTNKRQLTVSLKGSNVHRGVAVKHLKIGMHVAGIVISEEDHGYIVDIGITGINCFLPRKFSEDAYLNPGRYLSCLIHEIYEDTRVIELQLFNHSREKAAKTLPLSLQSTRPGTLLSVVVEKKTEFGLLVNYMDSFRGFIDLRNLDRFYSKDEWKKVSFKSVTLKARVLALNKAKKWIKLSLQQSIIQLNFPRNLPPLGSTINDLKVVIKTEWDELLLQDSANSGTVYILPPSESEGNNLIEGDTVSQVRTVGYHLVEGLVVCSNLKSKVGVSILHPSHLEVGQRCLVRISEIKDFGLIVSINELVSALCPLMHTSDAVVSSKLQKKFKVGQSLWMRVWEINENGIIVTNKKSVVECLDSECLASYENVQVGGSFIGIIGNLSQKGVLVRFFNKIKGFLPAAIINAQGIKDSLSAFREGQIVRVTVVKCDSRALSTASKLTLCLDLGADLDKIKYYQSLALSPITHERTISEGNQFVCGVVAQEEATSFDVALDDGRLGILEKFQLFDFADTLNRMDPIGLGYCVGTRISDCLVFEEKPGKLILTVKPLLVKLAIEDNLNNSSTSQLYLPSDLSEFHPGQVVVGYIRKVETYGVIVQFKNGLTALAPRPSLSDKFMTSPIGVFNVNDSVRCIVQRVDMQKQKIFVSFKSSLVPKLPVSMHSFLLQWLLESYRCAIADSELSKFFPDWKTYRIGSVTEASVYAVEDYGVVFLADDSLTFIVAKSVSSSKILHGKKYPLLILDVDFESSVLVAKIVEKKHTLDLINRKSSKIDVIGEVVHVTSKYSIILLADGTLGYLPTADYNAPKGDSDLYNVNQKVQHLVFEREVTNAPTKIESPHQWISIFSVLEQTSIFSGEKAVGSHIVGSEVTELQHFVRIMKVGRKFECIILSIQHLQMNVQPYSSEIGKFEYTATVHLSEYYDQLCDQDEKLQELLKQNQSIGNGEQASITPLHPFSKYRVGMKIECEVAYVHCGEGCSVQFRIVTPQTDWENLPEGLISYYGARQLQEGNVYTAVITEIRETGVIVMFSPFVKTEISYCDISHNFDLVQLFKNSSFIGLRIRVAVLSVISNKKNSKKIHIFASRIAATKGYTLQHNADTEVVEARDFISGQKIVGVLDFRTYKLPNPPFITVILPGQKLGRVCVTELRDREEWGDLSEFFLCDEGNRLRRNLLGFQHGSIVQCLFLRSNYGNCCDVSLRNSRLVSGSFVPDSIPQGGDILKGYVISTSPKGCFVRLANNLTGRVLLRDLSDSFLEEPSKMFPIGKLTTARVIQVDKDHETVQLTTKASILSTTNDANVFRVNDIVMGVVRRVTDFGVFVSFQGTSCVGLARKSFAVDDKSERLSEVFEVGDAVKAKIVSISEDFAKIGLDIRPSAFLIDQTVVHRRVATELVPASITYERPPLSLDISWDSVKSNAIQMEMESNSDRAPQQKVIYKRKALEADLRLKEFAAAEASALPKSVDEFERLVIANPNSSLIWIRYITFYVQAVDFESARMVGKRAIKSIHFREEEEKLNIWLALLNLEYKYGTIENLQTTFAEALKENKAKRVYLELVQLYATNNDFSAASSLLQSALKSSQFRKSKKIWLKYLEMLLRQGDSQSAKRELSRAMQSLSMHKHIETISRYGLLEYEYGSQSNARVVFEDLLASYPKRSDLWFIYVDQEKKLLNISLVRQLYNRMVTLPFSSNVMKTIFKKYLTFEVQFGTASSQEQVKEKAKAYVSNK